MARHSQPHLPTDRDGVQLPPRIFFYTLEQISIILDMSVRNMISQGYVHLEGRSIGVPLREQFVARNIAPPDKKPEWRVAEKEFVRWLKRKGFKFYERGSVLY